ncbi:hypothetical protein BpHYR1_053941 [Brachionus plicatilis]|uniref:Uncharacterized protein n=1 Tax=Brachionus plicatilis TaxID=10195 RepID=A0A3M7SRU9_BRAPC|nr:hypothetical protein BpHYR1_053941 [Brachionus plicatilis]
MMLRSDPPIYSQNNNIPIVVCTQQGHTVQHCKIYQYNKIYKILQQVLVYVRPCTKYPTHALKHASLNRGIRLHLITNE